MQFWWFCLLFLVYLQIGPSIAGYTVHANQGCMKTMDACKPWMTHTHPLWCDNHFWWQKTGRKHLDLVGLSENRWKMKKWGFIFWGKVQNDKRPTRSPWFLHAILAQENRFPCGFALYGAVGSSGLTSHACPSVLDITFFGSLWFSFTPTRSFKCCRALSGSWKKSYLPDSPFKS